MPKEIYFSFFLFSPFTNESGVQVTGLHLPENLDCLGQSVTNFILHVESSGPEIRKKILEIEVSDWQCRDRVWRE